jgi:superfamily II DNA or RNA helicase
MSPISPKRSNQTRWAEDSVSATYLLGAPSDDHFDLHLAAIEYELASPITIKSREDILSREHWSEKLSPFEHQIQNLITFCRRAPVALFADDVGLGKTISAGLVLNELQTRKKVRRALILCPKSLIPQWMEELDMKFGVRSVSGVGPDLSACLRGGSPVVITTYDSARDRMDSIRAASFDMVILDEAHRLRNLFGANKPPELATAVHTALAGRSFKYVLMLTATPIQNRLWDIYSLIQCLSVARGHENPLGNPTEFVARYVADGKSAKMLKERFRSDFRAKVQEYMVRTSRSRARLAFPKRQVQTLQCEPTQAEKSIQTALKPVFEGLNALTQVSLAEALMSSPRALLSQLRRMQENKKISHTTTKSLMDVIERVGDGCKLGRLLEVVGLLKSENPDKWRVLVFSKRLETVGLICERLRELGVPTGTIRGGEDRENQKNIEGFRLDPPRINALISTDAGAVGLNLQACNVVVNFDLPWNPMVLEQRIGRVQRLNSKFKYVEVLNLTVKGSVEDRIVASLVGKLQAVSDTLGDVEAILEASSLKDDEGFEEELRSLVTRALMGHNVEEEVRLAQESIARAKSQYEAEKKTVEDTLGGMDDMHRKGATAPELAPTKPRVGVVEFCRKAFACEGWRIEELPKNRLKVHAGGRGTWEARFDDDPSIPGLGQKIAFGGPAIVRYEEGSPAFEGLLGEWRKRFSHRILDRIGESENAIDGWLQEWAGSISPDLELVETKITKKQKVFSGSLALRATAWVAHDRFEKICTTMLQRDEHVKLPKPPKFSKPLGKVDLKELIPEVRGLVESTVETDSEIKEFIRFYEARKKEEIELSGDNNDMQRDVAQRFETSLASEIVGCQGDCYLVVDIEAVFTDNAQKEKYPVHLVGIPLANIFIDQPPRDRCQETKSMVPISWLGTCFETRKRVLKHLLDKSARSGIVALASYFSTCDETGICLLKTELSRCDATGKQVDSRLLKKSGLSDRWALKSELKQCEFTGVYGLPNEMEKSGVSGRIVRADEIVISHRSGIRGHKSEMIRCSETRVRIAISEASTSDYSSRLVATDLLVASEKNPERLGLPSEIVSCQVTGRKVLMDEAVQSVISGTWVEKDAAVYSDATAKPMLPTEGVRCEVSGALLLPTELGKSEFSGKRVDRRLLLPSEVSGRLGIEAEFRECEVSKTKILADEGYTSVATGRFVRLDETEASVVSGSRAHKTEMRQCAASGAWLLKSEMALSDYSGLEVDPGLLRASEKPPGRRGLEPEFRICAFTGRRILLDEGAVSSVSETWVDKDLLLTSPASGIRALQSEMVVCQQTGLYLLPDEVATCSISGLVIDLRRMVVSAVSGLKATKEHGALCEITGAPVLKSELIRSASSGRMFRADQAEMSSLSGTSAHKSELLSCTVTGLRLLPSEAGRSSVSDRIARRDLLIESEKSPRRFGLLEETVLCEITGKRLLADEVGASAHSGKIVDKDLLVLSAASDATALEFELVDCEETGVRILPNERAQCSVTGRLVDKNILVASELTERLGLRSKSVVCEFSGKIALEDEVRPSEVSGKRCFREFLEPSALSGALAHPYEMAVCSHTGDRVLPSELVRSSLSKRTVRRDLAIASDRDPRRVGLPTEVVICSASGRRLLADEVVKSEYSSKWIDSSIAVNSPVSGRVCGPMEMVNCEESGIQILPDDRELCDISGKWVDPRILVTSALSGRRGIPSESVHCDFSNSVVLSDEVEKSTVSGRLCRKDLLGVSVRSGAKAHVEELVCCGLSGETLLPSEVSASAISSRIARHDLLICSEKIPGRLGYPDEIRVCSVTAKRLLLDEVSTSDFSGKYIDSSLAVTSGVSERKCLPSELIICEESRVRLLPDETDVCSISGRRVNKKLLSHSEFSGKIGLSRILVVCPETRKAGFPEELILCEATGCLVDPDRLETCAASGKQVLRRLMVQCSISSLWVHRELAVQSSKSWRWANPEFKATCHWSGQTLLQDETALCRITNIRLEKQLILSGIGAAPVLELVRKGPPAHLDKSQVANSLLETLGKVGIKARAMSIKISPTGNCAVYYVDCSGIFGLRKKQAVGFALLGSKPELLGTPSIGLLVNNEWVPEN